MIDDITLIDQTTVGLNELGKENSFEVYPNPTEGNLTLTLSIPIAIGREGTCNPCKIIITDILSKEVLKDTYKEEIDVSYLEKGIYFLSLYNGNRLIETKKVVKE